MTPNGPQEVQLITTGPAFDSLGLVHRVRVPAGSGPHPTLLMLHGLNGTEDVTWVFARNAGPEWLIISPRAPFAGDNGYTWKVADSQSYNAGLDALTHFVASLPTTYPVDRERLVLLGFSQGAAMAYAFGISQPVAGIATLSGFIPQELTGNLSALTRVPILILHGTQDDTIPIATARKNRDQLVAAGAEVDYLEAEVGHKVSSGGMAELKRWLKERLVSGLTG